MAFQLPVAIQKIVSNIQRHEYVLPAIQREFVWKPLQICRLFDSIMQGYPIGSFLFWKVEKANFDKYTFYDFVRNYHERDAPHCPSLNLIPEGDVVAVLDGQQRLTALNIGLLGSLSLKEPAKWWNNPNAFPTRRLYLNLLDGAGDNDLGLVYDFTFLTKEKADVRDDKHYWFPVSRILDLESGPDMMDFIVENSIASGDALKAVFRTLSQFHDLIHKAPLVNYYMESSQNLDKVLNIFIRTNSGGTVLSYSDLLLSIATAQWDKLDARSEIHDLVDDLNKVRNGFAISQDLILKAGLMLSDIASVGFRVTNFNKKNMAILQDNWGRRTHASSRQSAVANRLLPLSPRV